MRHSWRGVLAALLALSLAVPACAAPAEGEAAARREDLEFLYQTLERAHPDLFANTPEGQFLERKAAIEAGLEEVDDFTFALELQSLTALAGDSHTTLALGGSLSQTVHYYPMSLLHRDGRWYLSAAPAERRELLGREVTAVNGRSMEETADAFGTVLSADNGVKLRRQYRQSCNVAEFYEYLGLVQEGGPLELTLAGGGELVLSPVPAEELGQTGLVRLSDGLSQPVTGAHDRFYLAFPLNKGTYYIQYNSCREDPELPMETFTAQVMADLEQGSYSVLLLDLRNNGGGSDGVIIPLLMELAPLVRSGELELWGLVGEATFSSASINALEIREMGGGLAGEPTSGSVDHFGSTGSFTLPNTGVRVSMSTKFIDTGTLLECAAGLGVEPIQPDVTVYQTLEDYLAGQDTLVDALCARTEPFQPQERPDAPLSRGRLTELLRQAAEQAGLDTQAPMQSLSDLLPCAWYAPGVCWALSSGVASGTGEAMFQASRPVTRQEGAAMVWQTARLLGMAPSGTAELTDAGSIASWALDAAQWAVSAGGLDTQNGAFHPQDTLTRAEGEALLSLLP